MSATSVDGAAWVQRSTPAITGRNIAYCHDKFVVLAEGTNVVNTSSDGIIWTSYNLPSAINWKASAYGNGAYVAVGTASDMAATSPDGAHSGYLNLRTISTLQAETSPAKPVPGSNDATTTVTGLSTFTATDAVEAWIMGSDATASHNSFEHAVAPIRLRITNPITGTGFTIQATSEYRLTGDFKVRFAFTS
jgi:hypothetical protein